MPPRVVPREGEMGEVGALARRMGVCRERGDKTGGQRGDPEPALRGRVGGFWLSAHGHPRGGHPIEGTAWGWCVRVLGKGWPVAPVTPEVSPHKWPSGTWEPGTWGHCRQQRASTGGTPKMQQEKVVTEPRMGGQITGEVIVFG